MFNGSKSSPILLSRSFFSQSQEDINFILKGENFISAGNQIYTEQSFLEAVKNAVIDGAEERFLDDVKHLHDVVQYLQSLPDKSVSDVIADAATKIGQWEIDAMEKLLQDAMNVLTGENGSNGLDGRPAILHIGGISFYESGTLSVKGGDASRGGNASNSLVGTANGGDGGNGGSGVLCAYLLVPDENAVKFEGGEGGAGGDPSKGVFGLLQSSGNSGRQGSKGIPQEVSVPRLK